jgi:murein DD-endopeptidase MepM/ murein hydrolase activator NlpD
MALGYALLHPNRLELSIRTAGHNRLYDEMSDAIFGVMGIGGELGRGLEDYLQGRLQAVEAFVESLRPWLEPNGPLGWLRELIDGGAAVPDLGAVLDRLTSSLSSVAAFKETLRTTMYAFVDGLPDATSARLSVYLREQFDAFTAILETPMRDGRHDRAAHRGLRSAVTFRQVFGPYLEEVLSVGIELDIRRLLKRFIDDLLARFHASDIDRFVQIVASFRAQFDGLIRAFGSLNASFSISISAGGPSGMPDPPLTSASEALAAPHPPGHALWWIDLVTGVFGTFSALWEMIRTRNWKGREFDGVLNIIGILWQAVQTLMRAAFRDRFNLPTPEESDRSKIVGNWFFTDQGTLAINLLFRLLGSIYDMTRGPANWSLGFTPSLLKYYSTAMNTRATYLTARSYWYFHERKVENATTPASLNRIIWAIWGPWWLFASLFGFMPAWEDFTLEQGLDETRTIVTLILAMVIGPIAGYITLWQVSGKNPFTEIAMDVDWATFVLVATLWAFGLLLGIIIVANLETPSIGGAWAGLIVVAALVVVPLVAMPFLFRDESAGTANKVFLHWLIIGAGLFAGGALPYFLWWFYIDDGRDKLGHFDGKNVDTSPYKLPYRSGENWMCGQGVHGLFSHYLVPLTGGANDNHYSYDFNEGENTPALAARGGIVINVVAGNPNGEATGNNLDVHHMSWVPGHDPGTDLERVLTHAEYVHLSQNRAWAIVGDRIVQGYNLLDIDNTGRSALNHLHLNAAEFQRGTPEITYPIVFTDSTIRAFRNFPLITSWFPGGGHIDGKPMSMAFYESENSEAPPVLNPIRIQTVPAGVPPHTHVIEIDRRTVGTGALPASLSVRTRNDGSTPGVAEHSHTITLSQATLLEILRRKTPSTFTTDATAGHTHGFGAFGFGAFTATPTAPAVRRPTLSIVNPPAGQLLATRPGPYRLIGDQLVIRVNERATEYFLFGAHRPAIAADVALDRGVVPGNQIRVAGSSYQVPVGSDATARGTARVLSVLMRTAGPPIAVRAVPTIAIETRRRGRSAQLAVTFRTPAPRVASGTGAFDDIGQITPAALAAQIDGIVKNGWPAAPAGLTAAATPDGQVGLAVGGAAANISGSSSRIAEVFGGFYDPAAQRTRGRGPMPFSSGRLIIGAATPYEVPFLASPAEVRFNAADPAFDATNLTTSPLVITVLTSTQNVLFQASDNTADAIARRINTTAEGVRAFAEGGAVVVQTVAAGSSATIAVSKAPTGLLGIPVAGATAGTANPLTDSSAVAPETFVSLIDDARARATLPYVPATVTPQARLDAGRLAVEVGAGHSIAAVVGFTGAAPFSFTAVASNTRLETAVLPPSIALAGPAWLDFSIDTLPAVRIPLDGEGARIDLPALSGLPAAGETLTVSVNGGAGQVVTFTGNEGSIDAVASAIASASADIVVRVVYVLSIENARYQLPGHTLSVVDDVTNQSRGLPGAGFLRDRAGIQSIALGLGADELAVPANFGVTPPRDNGGPVTGFTVVETPAGANMVWQLNGEAGLQLRVRHTGVADPTVPDPLGFPTPFAASVSTAAIAPALDLRSQCREYVIELQNNTLLVVAAARMQLCGEPAMIRTVNPAELAAGVAPAVVNVTVVEPGSPDRTFGVDLTGLTTLDDVAQAFNEFAPVIRAWVTRPAATDLLHVETSGGGTGWRLRLDNVPMLLALGFGQDDGDVANNRLEVQGRGTVGNAQAVTHDEIRAALARAVTCTTGVLSGTLSVAADAGNIVLRALNGSVKVETEPPTLRARLNVTEAADRTTLAPGALLDVDNSSIILKVNGRTAAVSPVWGDQASVQASRDLASISAPDVAAMLPLLQSQSIVITVNGVVRIVPPAPATTATLEDVVEWIGGQALEAWVGLRQGRVTFESRGAGSARTIRVDFSAFATAGVFPAFTILGFAAADLTATFTITGAGRGSVLRTSGLPVIGTANSLEALLRDAAGQNASPQAIYDAEVDTSSAPTRIRLRTHVPAWTLQQTGVATVGPGSFPFTPPGAAPLTAGAVLETPYPAAQAIEPGVFELDAAIDPAAGGTRRVSVLMAGQPARLPALGMPAGVAVLNGKGFDITVGTTVSHVQFTADGSTTPAQIAAQIERRSGWTVRAALGTGGMIIETVQTGSTLSITLAAPPAATPNAITNNAATGFTLGSALPVQSLAAGSVPNMDAVTAADFQAVLARAYLDDGGFDQADVAQRSLDWRPYDALIAAQNYTTITSRRDGCMSAIEPIVELMPSLGWSRRMSRAPAVRGSVALPAFADTKALSGTLFIQLNDNAGIADIAAPVVVPVAFAAGTYTARDVAKGIHDELFARGIGQAGAFPDGTVVVESRVNGLAGSVRIPAPGTGTAGADQTLVRALIAPNAELFDRGYPGAGSGAPLAALPNGGRSRPGAAAASATWVFQSGAGGPTTVPINIAAGQPLTEVQRAVDSALATVAGGRIGLCMIGSDETLYVEQTGPAALMLTVNGVAPPDVVQPANPGDTPEIREDPAVGLRFTVTPRTIRYSRDRFGNGVEGEFDDCGWVRIPMTINGGFTAGLRFPGGLYWTAIRNDGAKTREYHPSGDMIIAAGVDPADATRAFVHRARYWISLTNGRTLGIVRLTSGEFLVEMLV